MEVEVKRVAGGDVGFVALPLHLIYLLQQGDSHFSSILVLELSPSRPSTTGAASPMPWFVAWNGATSNSSSIEVAESLAQCLELPDRAKVAVRVRVDLPEAVSVLVEPATVDDSEILELYAEYLETHILNEIMVLQEGRRFPVTVPGQGIVVLHAKSTTPRSVVKLTRGTELIVSVKKRQSNTKTSTPQFGKNIWVRIQDIDQSLRQECCVQGKDVVVVPTASIYMNRATAQRVEISIGQWVLARSSSSPIDDQNKVIRSAAVRVIYWDGAADGHAMVSAPLRRYLDVNLHSGLYIRSFLQANLPHSTSARISPIVFHSEKLQTNGKPPKQRISSGIFDNKPAAVAALIRLQQKTFLDLVGGDSSWPRVALSAFSEYPADKQSKASIFQLDLQCSGQIDDDLLLVDTKILLGQDDGKNQPIDRVQYLQTICKEDTGSNNLPQFESVWVKGSAEEALQRLKVLLSPTSRKMLREMEIPVPVGVLLYGPAACGKTQLALALARKFAESKQIQAHWVVLKCAELAGEPNGSPKRRLKEAVVESIRHASTLIVLDDLDALFSGTEAAATTALAEYIADVMDNTQRTASVAFLATASGPKTLPACLRSSGRFDYSIEIEPPGIRERQGILEQIVKARGFDCPQAVTSIVAAKCDGYDANDLEIMVDRAIHASASRYFADETGHEHQLTERDLNDALYGLVPAALKGVANAGKTGPKLTWDDVGGLQEVCRVIRELLELPVKFPKLFANAPLRLRTGVLLYGPPGCGKTHLVAAAAAACSLRFIPVKGPELLDKYIGASEQSVRDVFARAAAAAPCILFFDEFDAIAPKRGHDNTGVTDRVVNQLLAELDGVSALTGVFTFAATNRPDLIDAALLRPGRLDHLLFCDFPSQAERLDILRVLSRHLSMGDDIDLEYLSRSSEGFSGADLKAVLSDAELEAVHSAIEAESNRRPVISMPMLKSALSRAIPLQEAERRRFANIYSTFTSGRSSSKDSKGKKATLA